jgi:hypothetical protein
MRASTGYIILYFGGRRTGVYDFVHCKDKMLKQIFPEKEYRSLSPNFHIYVSVSELYIPTMGLPFLPEEICGLYLGINKSLTDTVEIGSEAAQFPEKEYINGIAVAVCLHYLSDVLYCINTPRRIHCKKS